MSISFRPLTRRLRLFHRLFFQLVIIFIALLLLTSFVVTLFWVDGHSMEPTLHDRQPLAVCLICRWLYPPHSGDIVIVQYEGNQSVHFVKRIAYVPGDRVEYQGAEIVLEPDQYFVIGDNKSHSTDSRVYGPIRRSQIIGYVIGRYPDRPWTLGTE